MLDQKNSNQLDEDSECQLKNILGKKSEHKPEFFDLQKELEIKRKRHGLILDEANTAENRQHQTKAQELTETQRLE